MKLMTWTVLAVAVPLLAPQPSQAQRTARPTPADTAQRSAAEEIRRLNTQEVNALMHHDLRVLTNIWSDDMVVTNPVNRFVHRGQVVALVKSEFIAFTSYDRRVEYVRVYGDAAVAAGSETVVWAGSNPAAGKTSELRFTSVWTRRDGTWREVARHANVVGGAPLAATRRGALETAEVGAEARAAADAMVHRFVDSWNRADGAAYGENYWPDAELVDPSGVITNDRSAIVQEHVNLWAGIFKGSHQAAKVRRIRMLGPDHMIVDFDAYLSRIRRAPAGTPSDTASVLYSHLKHVLERRGGVWKVIAAQNTFFTPAETPRPSAFAAPAGSNVVNVITREFAFQMPDTIPAGLTTFRLRNAGKQPHHLMLYRLDAGKTLADAFAALRAGGAHPAWMHAAGGPNAVRHGSESNGTVVLEPGYYIVFCHVKNPAHGLHFMNGMFKALTVTPSPRAPAALPAADLTVTLRDYSITLSSAPTRGHHVIAVTNAGTQRHELILSRLHPGKMSRDFVTWLDTQRGLPPVDPTGGVTDMAPGKTMVIEMDLLPGTYSMVCRVRDAGDAQPHDRHGMLAEFTVR
jgi:uncharacterized protein (TIGR02246 family)